ncbi:MAG TPA: SDR family oxidoreductase [Flavisolibacter sp.]|nr:SDR family oxidoreductase [Flavisolibacter sp.]
MSFALITGASKGIGKSIALKMAHEGFNVLLVARNQSLLQKVAEEIRAKYNVTVHIYAIDLSQKNAADTIYQWCSENNFEINALINNAGYGLSGKFENYSLQEHLDMLQVNMHAVVELTYLFLPQLKKQPKSYLMNISSSSAYQAVPYLGLYAATKSFVLQFTRALRYELKDSSVSVTCISPGATDTDFVNRAKVGPKALKAADKFNMKAEDVAAVAVKSMLQGKTEVIVGAVNKLGAFFVWLLPKKLVESTAAKLYE